LSAAINEPNFPDRLLAEGRFYQACLAIESGDSLAAFEALTQGVEQDSSYRALQSIYLGQMSRQ
jgi:hypothetical protein